MRVGVSGKVFLGYAVVLVAFATTAAFLVAYLQNTGQQAAGHTVLLDVSAKVDAAQRQIEMFDREGRTRHRMAGTYFQFAADSLEDAWRAVDRFLKEEPGTPQRPELEEYVQRLGRLEGLARQTGVALIPYFEDKPEKKQQFDDLFISLRNELDIFGNQLQADFRHLAVQIKTQRKQALQVATLLGVAGLVAAVGAALWLWRTLRPLHELRLRARRIGSGDYGQRVGLYPRDEIGDLAREFDGMARALDEREQRLIRSERLATVGKVAAQITHEIRNPLASIGLNAELLGDELGPEHDEGRRLLGAITGEVDRLSEITESYLRYVRLPRPKLEPEDPAALVSAVMEFARAELHREGVELELEAPPGLPEIAADENQLRQALLNLVRNGKEAMSGGGGGRLRVTVGAVEGRVFIRLADTGPGIAAQNAGRIFEPFFSTKEKGTGLGLALVQQIVTEHGGRIEVSSAPGGTAFQLSFPALAPLTGETPAPVAGAADVAAKGREARGEGLAARTGGPSPLPSPR